MTLEELRGVDLFDELDDAELAEWVPLARAYHVEPGELIAEQGDAPRGLQLLLEGEAACAARRPGAHRARRPPRGPHLDGRDRGADGRRARGAHAGGDTPAGWR